MSSMFSSSRNDEPMMASGQSAGRGATTVIARGVKVEGEFSSQGGVLIEGEVHGNLSSTGLLTVGPEAKIKADVHASDAVISGSVDGNVTVDKRLELKATAKINGDIMAQTVMIEAGASVNGRMAVGAKALE